MCLLQITEWDEVDLSSMSLGDIPVFIEQSNSVSVAAQIVRTSARLLRLSIGVTASLSGVLRS